MNEQVKIRTITIEEYEKGKIPDLNYYGAEATDLALYCGLYSGETSIDDETVRYGTFHLDFGEIYDEKLNGNFFPIGYSDPKKYNEPSFGKKHSAHYYHKSSEYQFLTIGVRPILEISSPSFFDSFGNNPTLLKVGEYPQYVVGKIMDKKLDELQKSGDLKKTGKSYTLGNNIYHYGNSVSKDLNPQVCEEYEYDGKKYVKVKQCNKTFNYSRKLRDMGYGAEDAWMEVTPVSWIVDKKNNILISKNILLSGIHPSELQTYLMDCMFEELSLDVLFKKIKESEENRTNDELGTSEEVVNDKNKFVELIRNIQESGIELSEKQKKILEFHDNKALREQRQQEIRNAISLENEEKAKRLDHLTSIKMKERNHLKKQVDMLTELERLLPGILSEEQKSLIEYAKMREYAESLPHEVDTGMNPEIREWYKQQYEESEDDVLKR